MSKCLAGAKEIDRKFVEAKYVTKRLWRNAAFKDMEPNFSGKSEYNGCAYSAC
jgi:hypothetical protein